jgi:hypothetical protein
LVSQSLLSVHPETQTPRLPQLFCVTNAGICIFGRFFSHHVGGLLCPEPWMSPDITKYLLEGGTGVEMTLKWPTTQKTCNCCADVCVFLEGVSCGQISTLKHRLGS